VKVMQADPNAPVESVLGAAVVKANPFLRGMTVAGLQAWADRKMGGSQPQAAPAPASPASPPSAPLQIAPQQPRRSSRHPPAAPQPQQDGGLFAQMPAEQMQAPPIFFAPRRSPISRNFARPSRPPFSRG
jgi:hypothetical protein